MKDKVIAALAAPAILATALGGWYLLASPDGDVAPRQKMDSEPMEWGFARTACKQEIKNRLHDPDSAQFPPQREFRVSAVERDVYHVIVDVRARNAFNALRLNTYQCEIRELRRDPDGQVRWKSTVKSL